MFGDDLPRTRVVWYSATMLLLRTLPILPILCGLYVPSRPDYVSVLTELVTPFG